MTPATHTAPAFLDDAARWRVAGRWLSTSEKKKELADWECHKAASPRPAGDPGGHGYPDPEMILWCDRLNAIPGICTLQSCSGHGPDEQGYRSSGHLWLRMSEPLAHTFHRRAFELSEHPAMERVSLIYQSWGHEVVELVFRGVADGMLDESMSVIARWLEGPLLGREARLGVKTLTRMEE